MCRPARSDSHLRAAVTVVAVVTVATAIARPVLHAAETALQIALITAAVAAGVAALAAVAFIVIRLHRRQARVLTALPSSRALAAGQSVAAIPAPRLLAIEAPRQSAAEALGLELLEEREPDLVPGRLGASARPAESFATVRSAGSGEVLRGVSFAPGTTTSTH